jgi:uncharacterized protein with ParB-like and HNH nuclease domain
MKAVESIFSALFQTEGNQWHFHIPKYQREYTWGKYNWSKLLEDIYENEPGHYMGSIICVHDKEEVGPHDELIYDVVDGQQRLTTLTLLLMAIYYKYKYELQEESDNEDDEVKDRLNSIRKKLVKKIKADGSKVPHGGHKDEAFFFFLRVQPSAQFHNLEDYIYILSEIELIDERDKPRNCGNRSLYKAYSYFFDQIPNIRKELDELLDRINRLNFIHISEASQSKAFILFETLNYRGVPLSAIDIIKNKMLSVMEIKHGKDIDISFDKWQRLLQNLPTHEEQDRFLRQFYNAFKYKEAVRVEKVPKATSSTLIKIYETLIKRNAEWLFDELIDKSKVYNQLIEPEKYGISSLMLALVDLERIGAAASYTFLLYLFSNNNHFENEEVLLKTVQLFCKYYLRRNITDTPNTRDLDAINIELIERCEQFKKENDGKISYEIIEQTLLKGRGKPSDIKTFREYLADNLFYYNEGMARYVLAKLDETAHSREYKPDLWSRNEKGLYVWTVEHVFPQGENIPKEWIEMIADGDKIVAQEIRDELVHCLGNLTLSGYNSKLSNYSFEKKQTRSEANILGHKIKIGYQNGMALNNISFEKDGKNHSLATCPRWTKEMIQVRNEVMVKAVLKLFAFTGEVIEEGASD